MLDPASRSFLAARNRERFIPALPTTDVEAEIEREALATKIEHAFLDGLRAELDTAGVPRTAEAFVAWFEDLREHGPGQGDPLFDFLAHRATRSQLRWFLAQEVAGEAGFEDLVALTQLGFPTRPKLEMARNYWDEMGRGNPRAMHGPMLEATAREIGVEGIPSIAESVDLANLMTALARHRRYAFHAVGALGAIELTAPTRTVHVHAGLERIGISAEGSRYFLVHSAVDLKHSRAWNAEVLAPLVEARPDVAPAIAEGALLRLAAGARCFAAYRAHFGAIALPRAGARTALSAP